LDEINDIKVEKNEQFKDIEEIEMIDTRKYEEEKHAYIIYGAGISAFGIVFIVAFWKIIN